MADAAERFRGALLGLALGDALGAPWEGGLVERALWRVLGKTRDGRSRWTDDTQMSLDLADSLVARGRLDVDDVAARFAASYRWSRGYGPGAAKTLKRIRRGMPWADASRSVYPAGSFGNGGAMRAPVIGLFFAADEAALVTAASDAARITHAHREGIAGAVIIAGATARALRDGAPDEVLGYAANLARRCDGDAFVPRLDCARQWLATGHPSSPRDVRLRLGNGVAAVDSCVTALYLATRFLRGPFLQIVDAASRMGGDVDTICAMAGAVWGAANGAHALPTDALDGLEARERIEATAVALHARAEAVHAG